MSYSQEGEERAILEYFTDQDPGVARFLDVGAYHPTTFSNTRALFERGWSGVLIEPCPYALAELLAVYGNEGRIQIVAGAVGVEAMPTQMWFTSEPMSTSHHDIRKKWEAQVQYVGRAQVVPLTWAQVTNWWGHFDFVSIDTEGASYELFIRMLDHQKPRCVCVEYDQYLPTVLQRATTHGYKAIYSNGTNVVLAL